MATPAPWWDNPQAKDGAVRAHTPDETKYHYPDDRQGDRMRHGIMGVVIPRANEDGTSKGFSAQHAAVVHVDPDAPDGGAIVDLSRLSPGQYYDAFARSQYPHEVFYRIGVSPGELARPPQAAVAPPPRTNDLVPGGTYVVPASGSDGAVLPQFQEPSPMQPVPPLPPLPPQAPVAAAYEAPMTPAQPLGVAPAPAPQAPLLPPPAPSLPPAYAPPYPGYYPAPVPPMAPSPELQQMQQTLARVVHAVDTMAQHLQRPTPPVPPLPAAPPALRTMPEPAVHRPRPLPMPEERLQAIPRAYDDDEERVRPQTVAQVEADAAIEDRRETLITGFETLGMAYVNGPLPNKARQKVWITIPGGGMFEARYHEVIEGKDCIALVYDTRYEEGQQFVPPDLGADKSIELRLPGNKQKKKPDRVYRCASMGFHYSHGCFDVVVLVRNEDDLAVPSDGEDDE